MFSNFGIVSRVSIMFRISSMPFLGLLVLLSVDCTLQCFVHFGCRNFLSEALSRRDSLLSLVNLEVQHVGMETFSESSLSALRPAVAVAPSRTNRSFHDRKPGPGCSSSPNDSGSISALSATRLLCALPVSRVVVSCAPTNKPCCTIS